MKKRLSILLGASMLLLAACGGGGSSAKDGETIKIGVNLELSGAVSAYGIQERDGIELAVDKINDEGGILGKQIELVVKDNKSETAEAVSVTASLTNNDKVVAIIGPATSGAAKATIPNLTKAKVPAITPSGTNDEITVVNGTVQEYIFRTSYQDSFQGSLLAKYASDNMGKTKGVIIGDNSSDYGKGLTKAFEDEFKGDVVEKEYFVEGDKDFKAILTKIKDKDFDFIYIPGYYTEAGLIIKQAREMGIKQPILGADGFSDSKLVDVAGAENVNDVFYTSHFSENAPANDTVADFVADFKAKNKDKSPSSFNALAYDSVFMLKTAIENAGEADSEKIKEELANLKEFVGVTGTMTMDENHNPVKAAVVIGLTNGEEATSEIVQP
ncbi:ABC transporter substrate-binding protein [Vagococcus salmoninarum]|uniref:ABC transporter substrate-binding protein n=1 Tax=Vagococcus salmoninarum TaxID=2739 RepID=UPI00188130A6|nr:ABC transporter substrate-binding protein [Vagococcus salmoninarum]MBE9389483.1 ABC transporter substrate-binding protein [Vagococcus salmoninarum]